MLAVIKGSRELVLTLLENGANILLKETKGLFDTNFYA